MMNSTNMMAQAAVSQKAAQRSGALRNGWMRRLAATTVISGITATCPIVAHATEQQTPVSIDAEVAQSTVVRLDIPAQELDRALTSFADQANLKLLFPSQGLNGLQAPELKGEMTVEAALDRLLSGTGHFWRYTDGGTITIEPLSETGENVTDAIRIEANSVGEKADGPVEGYIATQSLAATKTGTPILETSQSITVVTQDQMEDQGSQTIMQAMRYTPGAFTGQVGASNRYDYVILRGLVDRSIDNIYLDGLKTMGDDSTYSSMQIDPYFVERADVVRGPASVLYGRSSPGGIVALSSKKPQFE